MNSTEDPWDWESKRPQQRKDFGSVESFSNRLLLFCLVLLFFLLSLDETSISAVYAYTDLQPAKLPSTTSTMPSTENTLDHFLEGWNWSQVCKADANSPLREEIVNSHNPKRSTNSKPLFVLYSLKSLYNLEFSSEETFSFFKCTQSLTKFKSKGPI